MKARGVGVGELECACEWVRKCERVDVSGCERECGCERERDCARECRGAGAVGEAWCVCVSVLVCSVGRSRVSVYVCESVSV